MNRRKMLTYSGLLSGSALLSKSNALPVPPNSAASKLSIYNVAEEISERYSLDDTISSIFEKIDNSRSRQSAAGAAVYFPPGMWEISNPLKVPDNTILFGMGGFYHQNHIISSPNNFSVTQHTVIKLRSGSNCNIIEPPPGNYLTGVLIQGLVLDGNKNEQDTDNSSCGIFLPDSEKGERSNLAVRDVMIYNCTGDGFYAGNKQHEIRIENTHSSFNNGNGYKISGQDMNLYNVWAGNNLMNGFHFSGGGALKSINVDTWSNRLNGLLIDNFAKNLVFNRFQSNSNTENGIRIEGGASSISFIGSIIKTNSAEFNKFPEVYTSLHSDVLLTGKNQLSPSAIKFIGCEFGEANVSGATKFAVEDTSDNVRPNIIVASSFYENEFRVGIANDKLFDKYIIENCTAGKRGGVVRFNNPKEYIFTETDYSVQLSNKIIEVNTTGNDVLIYLPQLADFTPGREFIIVKTSPDNKLTLKPRISEKINGADTGTEIDITEASSVRVIHAKTKWLVLT